MRQVIKPLAKRSPHRWRRDGTMAVHRIIDIDSTHITTQSETKTFSWFGTFEDFKKKFTIIKHNK